MEDEPNPGDCVVVTRNLGDHPARVGDRYIVHSVDGMDSTFRGIAQGSSTIADFWIPLADVERVEFGWKYARRHLPPDVVALLSACDGIEFIGLGRTVKAAVLESLPDWRQRVEDAIPAEDPDEFDDE